MKSLYKNNPHILFCKSPPPVVLNDHSTTDISSHTSVILSNQHFPSKVKNISLKHIQIK